MVLMTSFQLVQNFSKLDIDVESISVSELLQLIEQYPSLLRRPNYYRYKTHANRFLMKMRFVLSPS